jgi:hypothetical protein
MAKKTIGIESLKALHFKHRTSIGSGPFARPKNKHKKKSFKKYRGQGR